MAHTGKTGALAALMAALALACAPVAGAQERPPGSPPGANDFSCKPTAERPHPVILLHGLSADMSINFTEVSPALKEAGFCVFATNYGDRGRQSLTRSVDQVAAFVDRVRDATGAQRVAFLGHSEGAVMSMYYTRRFGPDGVSHVIAVAGPLHGTRFPFAAQGPFIGCDACADFAPDSAFIRELTRPPEAPLPTRWTTIVTRYDELVLPFSSGLLDTSQGNVRNFTLQELDPTILAEHLAIITHPLTIRLAIDGLVEPAIPVPAAAAPELRLTRRCVGAGRLRMTLTGETGAVRDVNFKLDKRLVRRDTEPAFERTLDRRTLADTSARRLRAVVYLRGPGSARTILARDLPRCGLR